jgi:hypothetical protein
MHVILAIQEAEIRRIKVQGQLGQKNKRKSQTLAHKHPTQKRTGREA